MTSILARLTMAAWSVMLELAPWLLLGTLVAGLLHRLVPPGFIHRSFHGRLGVLKAVALGVPLPLCSCGVIPAALGLKKQGASDKAAMAFLISTPQTGVDSILVSAGFLGWPFALFKVLSAGLLGVIGGYAVSERPLEPLPEEEPAPKRTWRGAFDHGVEVLQTIWRWLVFGVLASAALQVFVPTNGLAGFADGNPFLAVLFVLVLSVPLYVCATASVPIAAALVASGFPPGAALVFLIAGPATNVATIGAVYRTFGVRSLAVYLTTVILGSIGLGLGFGFVLSPEASQIASHAAHHGPWATMSAAALSAALLYFAFDDLRRLLSRRAPLHAPVEIPVDGLTCGGCVRRLEQALRETEGVDDVEVQLKPGLARISTNLGADQLERVILDTGYKVRRV